MRTSSAPEVCLTMSRLLCQSRKFITLRSRQSSNNSVTSFRNRHTSATGVQKEGDVSSGVMEDGSVAMNMSAVTTSTISTMTNQYKT